MFRFVERLVVAFEEVGSSGAFLVVAAIVEGVMMVTCFLVFPTTVFTGVSEAPRFGFTISTSGDGSGSTDGALRPRPRFTGTSTSTSGSSFLRALRVRFTGSSGIVSSTTIFFGAAPRFGFLSGEGSTSAGSDVGSAFRLLRAGTFSSAKKIH